MWFRQKPKNRRLGREQVLDVKLRSSKVRAARNRLAAIVLGLFLATTMGGFLLWRTCRWGLDRLVYENPAFAIEHIEVQTDGAIAVEQLRRWAGVRPGMNLLGLDLARVKRDLELVPLIESVSVERVLPRTLRLHVSEREPVAQVNSVGPGPGAQATVIAYQLDAEGWVMLPLQPRERALPKQAPEPLPFISGLDPRTLQPGRKLDSPQIAAALRLVVCFDNSPMAGLVDLERIDVSAPEVLVATTTQGGEVTFGITELERQLRRWQDIFELGQKYGKVLATLDLAIANNIPARWLDASSVPPDSPKPAKHPRLRKAHV